MMKLLNKLSICIFLCFPLYLVSQVKPDATSIPPTSTAPLPTEAINYDNGTKVNFVRTWTAKGGFKSPDIADYADNGMYQQATAYFDGLGRPLEEVIKAGSPDGTKDIVTAHVYDAFGREAVQFLPYPVTPTSTVGLPGEFKAAPFTTQPAYYQNNYGDLNPYGQTVFEASPLTRPLSVFAPGGSWSGSKNPDNPPPGYTPVPEHAVHKQYLINTTADAVRIWNIGNAPLMDGHFILTSNNIPTTTATYSDNPESQLYKNITIDEHGKQAIEYIDKEGHIILKKVQISNSPSTSHVGWLCTYYVYDDFGLLRFVIQPKAVEWLFNNNWDFAASGGNNIIAELCFRYEYDGRKRMIGKQVPGKGWEFLVYDKRDRLILSQDAKLRLSDNWIITQYDDMNRPIKTFLIWDYHSFPSIQDQANSYPIGMYPAYQYFSDYLLSETYYDNYSFSGALSFNSHLLTLAQANYQQGDEYTDYSTKTNLIKGLTTGNRSKVVLANGEILWLITTIYYDDKGRLIQLLARNAASSSSFYGLDITTIQYSFTGKVLNTVLKHQKDQSNSQAEVILTRNTYANNLLIKTSKKINADSWKEIVEQTYDDLGKLKTKKLAPEHNGGQGLETLTYDYNIRNWLTGINKAFANIAQDAPGSDAHFFGMELHYDYGFSQKQFNGNITGSKWKSRGDGEQRAYGYTYDVANRLLRADFTQHTGGWNQSAGVNFDVIMGNSSKPAYDANGNIGAMQQWGIKPGSILKIDDLVYTYKGTDQYSNQLISVNEIGSTTNTHLGDFTDKSTSINDYNYDDNGNLTSDKNKNITSISYNYLSLPVEIVLTGNKTIKYIYDAGGNKHQKIITEPGKPIKTTLYAVGGILYENDVLQMIGQEEGRIRPIRDASNNIISYAYDYFIKDHLGNVRTVLTDEQQQDNYPIATLESGTIAIEENYYDNLNVGITYPAPPPFGGSSNTVQVLRKTSTVPAIGSAKLLKVMAGDNVSASVAYYYPNDAVDNEPADGLNSLVTLLIGLLNGSTLQAPLHGTGGAVGTQLNNNTDLATLFLPQSSSASTTPKAYLNVLFFDEQLRYISSGSYCKQIEVSGTTGVQTIDISNVPVSKNGYAYVYVSNESNNFVYFDDFHITHDRGPLLEETHYYPFGLIMAGISSKAVGKLENRHKFNDGTELNLDFDVSLYETPFRQYDPQIGRFHRIDPLAEGFDDWTPYNYSGNNPILLNDPTGLAPGMPGDPSWATDSRADATIVARAKRTTQFWLKNVEQGDDGKLHIKGGGNYSRRTMEFLQFRTNFENRGNDFDRGTEAVVKEALMWAIPWGRVFKGVAWLYKANKVRQAAKASQTIYRGSGRYLENMIFKETGYVMSDAAQAGYMTAKSQLGKSTTEAVNFALNKSVEAHSANLNFYGSMAEYAAAHSQSINLTSGLPRSMISFTTEYGIANQFAKGGTLFETTNTASIIFNVGGPEAEVLLGHMIKIP